MRFRDIPQFVREGSYQVDISLDILIETIDRFADEYGLQMQPDFQRAHVWTNNQASRYVEFLLRGGRSSRVIYFNHPGWMRNFEGDFVLVDGLQRVTACLDFLNNKIPVFDEYLYSDFEDKLSMLQSLKFNINTLQTKEEVLEWYLDLNSGGVVHTEEELAKVKSMLAELKG